MLQFQQRVIDEEKELATRIKSLLTFITMSPEFSLLPEDEKVRMKMQHNIMTLYQLILKERIANFHRT